MERATAQAPTAGWRAQSIRLTPTRAALALWATLVVGCAAWGAALILSGHDLSLNAPPLLGSVDPRIGALLAIPMAFAAIAVRAAPELAMRLGWRSLLAVSMAGVAAWAIALALVDGTAGISAPLTSDHEYLTVVGQISSAGDFLSHFTERISGYATHIRGHPPGMALIVWGLDRIGLGGPWPASALIVIVAASMAPAVLIAVREAAGESVARRAAPFVVIAPAAIWVAVSADALFAGVGTWAVALLALAIRRSGLRWDLVAFAGGVLFGIALFLSYGLILLAAVPLALAASSRRVRPIAIALVGVALVVLAFLGAGFWWLDGLQGTRHEYLFASAAQNRPYEFFVFNNLAALGLAVGPATFVAIARSREPGLVPIVVGGLAAIALADLSGMSKGEVERIWLPFMPWLLVAGACLWRPPGRVRAWLGAQAGCAIVIAALVHTPW
jgi:methylthioxylose transferase